MEKKEVSSAGQEQIHSLIFGKEIEWREIIYDLINTEQLDPWDIDLSILSNKYLEKIKEYEEADFFMSSKVLLAASLLLRLKSEILLNRYIKSIDEILFGKKEEKKYSLERIELEEEIPVLVPKSPIPRYKKVTIAELMNALNKAINTENRRIKKEIINKNALRESGISLPKRKFSIKDKIKSIHETLIMHFNNNKEKIKISFTEFVNGDDKEKLNSFSPLLHLENSKKIWLEQENHFEEIHIWMKKTFLKHNKDPYADLKETADEVRENLEELTEDKKD
jgi:segregation and condensation protein A